MNNWNGKWIWTDDETTKGQWVKFRKILYVEKQIKKAFLKISVDSKYWLWIDGKLVVFEGMVKNGPNPHDMYYDEIEITRYLKKGKNVIAILAVYFGKNGYGFHDTNMPGLIVDGRIDDYSLTSDKSWKVHLDEAYEQHETNPNYRLAEPNIKYIAQKEENGWQQLDFDDSLWKSATIKSEVGKYPRDIKLIKRPIPQLLVGEIQKSVSGWKEEIISDYVECLKLPEEYEVEVSFHMEKPGFYFGQEYDLPSEFGVIAGALDSGNYCMAKIVGCREIGINKTKAELESIVCKSGLSTVVETLNMDQFFPSKTLYDSDHTMKILVEKDGFTCCIDDVKMKKQKRNEACGGTVGFSNVGGGSVHIISTKIFEKDGAVIYEMPMEHGCLNVILSGVETAFKEYGENRTLDINTGFSLLGEKQNHIYNKRYTIRNRTNLQGTPYFKVYAPQGRRIEMYSDTYHDKNGDSIRHSYITKDGIQKFEGLVWFNGYDIYFEMPSDIQVIELGFRPSSYNTRETGKFVCDDKDLNILYRKCYDTLLVTMRDSFMDCPDRERTQWIGDAVNEMQMAAYAMDDKAMLLFRKALSQVCGWANSSGILPVTTPDGISLETEANLQEMPAQLLACIHGAWLYYMYTADDKIIRECYDIFLDYVKLWELDENGLSKMRDGNPTWSDWGTNADDRLVQQCWYYIALNSLRKMSVMLGKNETEIQKLSIQCKRLKDVFDKEYWCKEKSAYYYKTDNQKPDDRANALAVYAGLAESKRYDDIKQVILSTENASPYMEMYVQNALYLIGEDCLAMKRMKYRYQEMIDNYYPTLWEFWNDKDGTRNHAWTGAPLVMMYRYNAGIQPRTAGYKRIQIRPQLGLLLKIEAAVETTYGKVSVKIERQNDKVEMHVEIPDNCTAEIYVPIYHKETVKYNLYEKKSGNYYFRSEDGKTCEMVL